MQRFIKQIVKMLVVLTVMCGIATAIVHQSHAVFDKGHHQDSCDVCTFYRVASGGLMLIALVCLAVILVRRFFVDSFAIPNYVKSKDLSLLHSGLDPPCISY